MPCLLASGGALVCLCSLHPQRIAVTGHDRGKDIVFDSHVLRYADRGLTGSQQRRLEKSSPECLFFSESSLLSYARELISTQWRRGWQRADRKSNVEVRADYFMSQIKTAAFAKCRVETEAGPVWMSSSKPSASRVQPFCRRLTHTNTAWAEPGSRCAARTCAVHPPGTGTLLLPRMWKLRSEV